MFVIQNLDFDILEFGIFVSDISTGQQNILDLGYSDSEWLIGFPACLPLTDPRACSACLSFTPHRSA